MSQTVQLSDTIDQYQRKLHVNVRGKKVTMVLRWKDRASSKNHTQRVTFKNAELGEVIGLLCVAGEALGLKSAEEVANAIHAVVKENPFGVKQEVDLLV